MIPIRSILKGITSKLNSLGQDTSNSQVGSIHRPPLGRFINDGVNYEQPVILTESQRQALVQSGKLTEYLESYRSATHMQFDSPYKTDNAFMPVTEDPLTEWSWSTRTRVISNTHAAYQRNPIAHRGVKYASNFTIGEGFDLVCKSHEVDELLQEFIDSPDNRIRQYERQVIEGFACDGENILRLFSEGGKTVAVPMRPYELRYITTELGFFRRIESYHFVVQERQGDSPGGEYRTENLDIPASEILFVPVNAMSYELRGKPELYLALPYLKAYNDWLENRARLNYWRSVLMWQAKIATNVGSVISAWAARFSKPPTPGTVITTNDKVEILPLENRVAAGDAAEDGRQLKLMSAVALGIPEYMLSDGQNANLASSTNQELPALTTFSEYQRILIQELWTPLFRRVIQNAVDAGLIDEWVDECDADGDMVYEEPESELDDVLAQPPAIDTTLPKRPVAAVSTPSTPELAPDVATSADDSGDMHNPDDMTPDVLPKSQIASKILAVDAFTVSYKPLEQSDIGSLANALNIAAQNEWVDAETASQRLGFDYAKVQKNLKREKDRALADMAAGRKPTPPGMLGVPNPAKDATVDKMQKSVADDNDEVMPA